MHSVICLNSSTFRDVLWVPSSVFKKNAWYKWFGWIQTSRPEKSLVLRRHLIGGYTSPKILNWRHTQHRVSFVLCVTDLENTYFDHRTARLDLCIYPNNSHQALFFNTDDGTDRTSRNVSEFKYMMLRSTPEAQILIRNTAKASNVILCKAVF